MVIVKLNYLLGSEMIDLACYDYLTCFCEDELDDCKCPKCGSSRYDYYDEVFYNEDEY